MTSIYIASRSVPSFPVICSILIFALSAAATGCGADPALSNGGGAKCQVGQVVKVDSAGNSYCATATNNDGAINTDTAATDSAGAADGGADSGGNSDASGTSDAKGSDAGDASNGDAVDEDTGPLDPWWKCPPVKGTGLQHGKKCVAHTDCMYGYCMNGGFLTGYDDALSYCTKNNGCTGEGSFTTAPCDYDDNTSKSLTFKSAFEKSKSSGNDKRKSSAPIKLCARVCKTDGECANWNAELPHCMLNSTKYVSIGTQGVCGFDPTR